MQKSKTDGWLRSRRRWKQGRRWRNQHMGKEVVGRQGEWTMLSQFFYLFSFIVVFIFSAVPHFILCEQFVDLCLAVANSRIVLKNEKWLLLLSFVSCERTGSLANSFVFEWKYIFCILMIESPIFQFFSFFFLHTKNWSNRIEMNEHPCNRKISELDRWSAINVFFFLCWSSFSEYCCSSR